MKKKVFDENNSFDLFEKEDKKKTGTSSAQEFTFEYPKLAG